MDIFSVNLFLLFFMLLGISESEGEAIYSRTADETSFGLIAPLSSPPQIEDVVWYIAEDITDPNFFIIADGSSLKKFYFDINSQQPVEQTTLIGESGSRSYREGTYPEASFNVITGFVQVNWTHIMIVDSNNHCIRFLDQTTNSTSPYAGECQQAGDRSGQALTSQFNQPRQVVIQFDHIHVFVSDSANRQIKEIDLSTQMVASWVRIAETPLAITLNRREDTLFVTTPTTVLKITTSNKGMQPLILSTTLGFNDGGFNVAKLNHPHGIRIISRDVIMIAEPANNRMRVLNMKSASVSSVCIGEEGFSESAKGGNECKIKQPLSLGRSQHMKVILIGTNSSEMRCMTYTNLKPKGTPGKPKRLEKDGTEKEPANSFAEQDESMPKGPESMVVVVAVITAGVVVIAVIVSIVVILFRKYKAHKQRRERPTANLDIAVANAMKHGPVRDYVRPQSGLKRKSSNHYDDYTEVEETYQDLNYSEIENYSSLTSKDEQENSQ
ncbi:uncharacterized protein [Watersipora subatra]|uniref:uncharacterized protein isoform X2 n=1 Tax=Watersipora subatra TaxID=2589382 RepID=UPI00355B1F50